MQAPSLPRPDRLLVIRDGVGTVSISPMLRLIALVIFLPEELSFNIFDFRLTFIRLALFLLTPVLLIHLTQLLLSRKRHFVFSDILVVLTLIWMILSPTIVVDLAYSLHHSAPFAFEFCGGYLATRVLLSERGQAVSFVNLLCHVIAIVALIGLLDALTSKPLIHNFLHELTGYARSFDSDYRLGIFRAMGPTEHPILFGTICSLGFLLAVATPIRAKGLTIAACGLGVLLSLSSAPIQGAILGLGLLTYDRILRFRRKWWLLIAVGVLGIAASYAFTASPLASIAGRLSLDPTSYWIRVFQWNTVGTVVLSSPWVGIAFQWPEMVRRLPFFALESIDSLWLNLALTYGIPGAVLVGLSMIAVACYPATGPGLTTKESKLASTLGILIAVVVLLGFTVDFWETSWMLVGLLIGLRAHLADLRSGRPSTLTKTTPAHVNGLQRRSLGRKRLPA
jgi:hypothetical protein